MVDQRPQDKRVLEQHSVPLLCESVSRRRMGRRRASRGEAAVGDWGWWSLGMPEVSLTRLTSTGEWEGKRPPGG